MSSQTQCPKYGYFNNTRFKACVQCRYKLKGGKQNNSEEAFLEKVVECLICIGDKINEYIVKITTLLRIKINKFILSTEKRIERYRLTRRYNRKIRAEEKARTNIIQ